MSFGEALINVLAVLAVIIAGGFVIFFVGNFLLSYLESKPSSEKKLEKKPEKKSKKIRKKEKQLNDELVSESIAEKGNGKKKDMGTITEFIPDEPESETFMAVEEKKDDFNFADWVKKDKVSDKNFNEIDFNKMFKEHKDSEHDFFSKADTFKAEDLSVDDSQDQIFQDLDSIFNENEDFNFGDNFGAKFDEPEANNFIHEKNAKALPVMSASDSVQVNKSFYDTEREEQGITDFDEISESKTLAEKPENVYEMVESFAGKEKFSGTREFGETERYKDAEKLTQAEKISEYISEVTLPRETFKSDRQNLEFVVSQNLEKDLKPEILTTQSSIQKVDNESSTSHETDISLYREALKDSYFSSYDPLQIEPDKDIANASQYFKSETLKESQLKSEIEQLKQELLVQKLEYEQLKRESELNILKLQAELTELSHLYEQAERKIEEDEKTMPVLSIEEYEHRLETLKARLKINEKELRANKREFTPLQRVRKNLDKDKKKLRRKEAIVAKQKVMLYGVNNIAEIDPDKAKKLEQEMDLLDGLKISVQHCEEVIEANKERFPILETTYRILTSVNRDLKDDIAECEENIKQIKSETDAGDSDSDKVVAVKKSEETTTNIKSSKNKSGSQKSDGDDDDDGKGGKSSSDKKDIENRKEKKSANKKNNKTDKDKDKKDIISEIIENDEKNTIKKNELKIEASDKNIDSIVSDAKALISTDETFSEKFEIPVLDSAKDFESIMVGPSDFSPEENLSFVEFKSKKSNDSISN